MHGIPHRWDMSPSEAIRLQLTLAAQVDTQTPLDLMAMRRVAGVDVSVKNGVSRAAIVILTFPELAVLEIATAEMPATFPYIPGLLSFREGSVILEAQQKIANMPDVYIFDGQGIAHPRRLGIASHIGLWLDAPTVGCAKTWLVGQHQEPGTAKGDFAPMTYRGEIIGVALRSRANVKPVYVSPGHRATLDTARELIMRCVTRYRLPEPTRAAHVAAGRT